jgi:hypothetical protein
MSRPTVAVTDHAWERWRERIARSDRTGRPSKLLRSFRRARAADRTIRQLANAGPEIVVRVNLQDDAVFICRHGEDGLVVLSVLTLSGLGREWKRMRRER